MLKEIETKICLTSNDIANLNEERRQEIVAMTCNLLFKIKPLNQADKINKVSLDLIALKSQNKHVLKAISQLQKARISIENQADTIQLTPSDGVSLLGREED